MAVIVQDVVGTRHGRCFYPHVSAVARSIDYYPIGSGKPDQGVVHLALGLGKTIVDGGVTWSFSPARPKAPPPFASPTDRLKETQLRFWAVRLGPAPVYDPIQETEYMDELELADAEADGVLRHVASTFDPASGRFTPGTAMPGPRVIDFGPMLQFRTVPIAAAVGELLRVCEDEIGEPVEIELALTVERGLAPARLGFLQMRPLVVSHECVSIADADRASPDVLLYSDRCCGNGEELVADLVYVRPEAFEGRHTRVIAEQVAAMNLRLVAEQRPYALLGFGRWGSSDPWLGIPLDWSRISGARALVEIATPQMNVEPSQGSHFFHNLTSFRVSYMHVPLHGTVHWDWLDSLPAVTETPFLRHVRPPCPIRARVDGRCGRGGLWRATGVDSEEEGAKS